MARRANGRADIAETEVPCSAPEKACGRRCNGSALRWEMVFLVCPFLFCHETFDDCPHVLG